MSEASPDRSLGPLRELRDEEIAIIRKMVSRTSFEAAVDRQIPEMQVQDMPDGGMGSIKFYRGKPRPESAYAKQIAEAAFQDADGVPVSVTLSVDRAGDLLCVCRFRDRKSTRVNHL